MSRDVASVYVTWVLFGSQPRSQYTVMSEPCSGHFVQ